jgi:hypothetical protein
MNIQTNMRRHEMNVQQTIEMLQKTISKLYEYDPLTEVGGHCVCPEKGFYGDMEGVITRVGCNLELMNISDGVDEERVILYIDHECL